MIEVIKNFFGGSVSAIECFVGSVGLMGILSIFGSIFFNVYKGKKTNAKIEETEEKNKALIDAFINKYESEIEALKKGLTSSVDNICNMLLLELKKSGYDMETINAVIELYKKTAKEELLDTDKLQEEKQVEIEQAQTTQEEVNERINNIETIINNDLV